MTRAAVDELAIKNGQPLEEVVRAALQVTEALAFCDGPMESFLTDRGMKISQRAHKRLRKDLANFDPSRPLPHEIFERLCGS